MSDMKAKGVKELEAEQIQFAKFKSFCQSTLTQKQKEISDETRQMEMLAADAQKCASDATRLANEITVHGQDIEKASKQQADATAIREKERADFETTLKDYTESIDAMGRAIQVLKDKSATKKQAALLQLSMDSSLAETKKGIDSFLEEGAGADMDDEGAPKADGYKFQSGGIVSMLEGLQDKFVDERDELSKSEAKKKQVFDLLIQGLKNQVAQATKDKQEKTDFKQQKLQKKAEAEGSLQETTKNRAEDQKYEKDLSDTCKKKASDFDTRQQLRKEEIDAIQKAIDIISSGAVAGSGAKHLPKLLQKHESTSLAFLRSAAEEPAVERAVQFLQQQAGLRNSRVLAAMASKLGGGALDKVKKLIEALILKLNEEEHKEATKKAFCDKELAESKATRNEKTDAVASLKAQVDEITAEIAKLADDAKKLGVEIQELNKAVTSATDIRNKEKAKNKATIRDATEAQTAVAKALVVLKEFYQKAGEATSFVQTTETVAKLSEAPAIFDSTPYKGMGDSGGGVVGMLEVIESDFARLEAQTTAAEAAGKKEYEQFMEDTQVSLAEKQAEVDHHTALKAEKTNQKNGLEGDMAGTQKELDAAQAYYQTLVPDCVDAEVDYEQRKIQREKDIADLDNAVKILQDEA